MVLVHVRDGSVVLSEESEDDGSWAGGKVVDVEEGEWSYDDYEEERRQKNGVWQCRDQERL